jgi:hypothetical protein
LRTWIEHLLIKERIENERNEAYPQCLILSFFYCFLTSDLHWQSILLRSLPELVLTLRWLILRLRVLLRFRAGIMKLPPNDSHFHYGSQIFLTALTGHMNKTRLLLLTQRYRLWEVDMLTQDLYVLCLRRRNVITLLIMNVYCIS